MTREAGKPAAEPPTAEEIRFLHRHAGVPTASPAALRDLDARSSARAGADQAASLTADEAAARTGLTPSALNQMAARGELLAYPASARRGGAGYPDWQFTADGGLLPYLADVLAAMPQPTALVIARSFMTTPTTDLSADPDTPATSPVQWLATGRDPGPVLALAATLGEQA